MEIPNRTDILCPKCLHKGKYPERPHFLTKKRGLYRCSCCCETYSEGTLDKAYDRLQRRAMAEITLCRNMRGRIEE